MKLNQDYLNLWFYMWEVEGRICVGGGGDMIFMMLKCAFNAINVRCDSMRYNYEKFVIFIRDFIIIYIPVR